MLNKLKVSEINLEDMRTVLLNSYGIDIYDDSYTELKELLEKHGMLNKKEYIAPYNYVPAMVDYCGELIQAEYAFLRDVFRDMVEQYYGYVNSDVDEVIDDFEGKLECNADEIYLEFEPLPDSFTFYYYPEIDNKLNTISKGLFDKAIREAQGINFKEFLGKIQIPYFISEEKNDLAEKVSFEYLSLYSALTNDGDWVFQLLVDELAGNISYDEVLDTLYDYEFGDR